MNYDLKLQLITLVLCVIYHHEVLHWLEKLMVIRLFLDVLKLQWLIYCPRIDSLILNQLLFFLKMVIQFKDVIHHDVLQCDLLLNVIQLIHVIIHDFLMIIDARLLQLVNNDFL